MKTKTKKPVIHSVRLVRMPDGFPDTSSIGTYTNEYSTAAIVCATGEFVADIERRKAIVARCEELAGWPTLSDNLARAEYWSRKANRLAEKWADVNEIPGRSGKYRFFVPYAVGKEELTALAGELEAAGFSPRAVAKAIKTAKTVDK